MCLQVIIEKAVNEFNLIPQFRKQELNLLSNYIKEKKEIANLIFICTHNSRRSLLAQVWAQVAAHHYGFLMLLVIPEVQKPHTFTLLQSKH